MKPKIDLIQLTPIPHLNTIYCTVCNYSSEYAIYFFQWWIRWVNPDLESCMETFSGSDRLNNVNQRRTEPERTSLPTRSTALCQW